MRSPSGPSLWIRLNEPSFPSPPPAPLSWDRSRAELVRFCRWEWVGWAPTVEEGREVILGRLRRHAADPVAPVGSEWVGAGLVREVDLDPDDGLPRWEPAGGGLRLGPFGDLDVVALGSAPFGRSRGALVGLQRTDTAGLLGMAEERHPPPPDIEDAVAADLAGCDDWLEGYAAAAGVYDSAFRPLGLPLRTIRRDGITSQMPPSYLILIEDVEPLAAALRQKGIEALPAVEESLRARLREQEDRWPGAAAFAGRGLRLPCHPGLGLGELLYVADAVRIALQGTSEGR